MKIGFWVAWLCLLSLSTLTAGARKSPSNPSPSAEYVSALATANRFLHAWQTGDLETGTVLLGDRVRHSQDPEKFEQSFAGTRNCAFEISRGKGTAGRYRFPVVLLTTTGTHTRRHFSEIVVAPTGKNDWVVDKLP